MSIDRCNDVISTIAHALLPGESIINTSAEVNGAFTVTVTPAYMDVMNGVWAELDEKGHKVASITANLDDNTLDFTVDVGGVRKL